MPNTPARSSRRLNGVCVPVMSSSRPSAVQLASVACGSIGACWAPAVRKVSSTTTSASSKPRSTSPWTSRKRWQTFVPRERPDADRDGVVRGVAALGMQQRRALGHGRERVEHRRQLLVVDADRAAAARAARRRAAPPPPRRCRRRSAPGSPARPGPSAGSRSGRGPSTSSGSSATASGRQRRGVDRAARARAACGERTKAACHMPGSSRPARSGSPSRASLTRAPPAPAAPRPRSPAAGRRRCRASR